MPGIMRLKSEGKGMKQVNHSDLKFSIVEIEDQILTITINRPEVLNALHRDAHYELSRIFDEFAEDRSLRVAILTAAGDRGFCVGSDLKSKAKVGKPSEQARGNAADGIRRSVHPLRFIQTGDRGRERRGDRRRPGGRVGL